MFTAILLSQPAASPPSQKILLRPLQETTITLSWIIEHPRAETEPPLWLGCKKLFLPAARLLPFIAITNGPGELKASSSSGGFDARFGICGFSCCPQHQEPLDRRGPDRGQSDATELPLVVAGHRPGENLGSPDASLHVLHVGFREDPWLW